MTDRDESTGSDQPKRLPLRHVPTWAWVLGALLYPAGIFICLGVARALRWWLASALAVVSLGFVLLFTECVETSAPQLTRHCAMLGYLFHWGCCGLLQYQIGERRGVWTAGGRWVWRLGGYVLIAVLALGTLVTVLCLVSPPRSIG